MIDFRIFVAAAACLSFSLPAVAQETSGKPFRLQAALNLPDWFKVSGSIRPRYETLANQFVAGRTGDDEFFGVQTLLRAEIDAGAIVLGAEMLDSRRIVGDAGGATADQVETLEPLQAYLAWRHDGFLIGGAEFDMTIGRFTMDIGSRRLVARSGFGSVPSTFDGVRAVWNAPGGAGVTAFYTAPVGRLPKDTQSRLDNEAVLNETIEGTRFAGANIAAPLALEFTGEVYFMDLDEDDDSDGPTRNRDLSTAGLRVSRKPAAGAIDAELEHAWQSGTVRATSSPTDVMDLDHEATMLHAEAGYTFDAPWSPRLALQYDLASGDNSPTDLASERFDPLFGDRSFEFGPTGIYGAISRTNLDSPGIRLEVEPDGASDAYVMLRKVRLESATDAFTGTGVRDPSGASGDDVGTQIELRWRRWLAPDQLRLAIGAAALIRGNFLKTAPNATLEGDTYYGYTEITLSF